MKKKVVCLLLMLTCIVSGCGVKLEPNTIEKNVNQEQSVQDNTEQLTLDDISGTNNEQVLNTESTETIQNTEIIEESTESTEVEDVLYQSEEILNLNEIVKEISANTNGSIGYLFEQAKEKGYQNFALMVTNKSLYDNNLVNILEREKVPITVNFCLLTKNVDNEYAYFKYGLNDITKRIEVVEEPLIEKTKEKKISKIGYIEEHNLLYTCINVNDKVLDIFSNENGNIVVQDKSLVTMYVKDFPTSITSSYDNFSTDYKQYMKGMKEIEFSKTVEELKKY